MPEDVSGTVRYAGANLPVPDPTLLTTQQLLREMANLREVIFTRLDGNDRAIVLFNENLTRVPTDTDKQVQHLRELHEERIVSVETGASLQLKAAIDKFTEMFASIQVQFRERDVRSESSKIASDIALAAALQAAKEAVGEQNKSSTAAISKSEASTIKQIEQMGTLIQQVGKALDEKFSDVKDRLTLIEGRTAGLGEARASHQVSAGFIVAVISTIIAFVAVVIAILEAVRK